MIPLCRASVSLSKLFTVGKKLKDIQNGLTAEEEVREKNESLSQSNTKVGVMIELPSLA